MFHFPVRTTEGTKTTLSSVLTDLLGQEGQHLSGEDGVDCWASCLGVGVHSPFPCLQELKRRGFSTQQSLPMASWPTPRQLCKFPSRMGQKSYTQDPSSNPAYSNKAGTVIFIWLLLFPLLQNPEGRINWHLQLPISLFFKFSLFCF